MSNQKYIIVAGCYRSGTTALFNIVRLILKHSGVAYDAYFWEGKTKSEKEYQLIKTHTFSPGLVAKAFKIFVAHRKTIGVMSSMKKLSECEIDERFANAGNLSVVDSAMTDALTWIQSADYVQNFLMLSVDSVQFFNMVHIIRELLILPNTSLLDLKVWTEFRSLKAPKKGLDRKTLLTETHKKQQ